MGRLIANRYEVLDRLGGGGMGEVFSARDTTLQRDVAIKTVDTADADATTIERFRREAVATAGLSDPHVVSVYDAGFDDGDAYIVMEKLSGPSLAERIKNDQHLSIAETLEVALAVSRGLQAAHRVGVVHRDIKPGNVMYGDGQIKIVDFGIAQLGQQHGAALTAPATAMGTAAYMSPEQAMGRSATEKSDWYALGCLLMACLTGTPPFRGEAIAVAQQQISSAPPRARELRTGVPPALDELIDRLLAKDPEDRPSGAQIIDQVKALHADPDAPTQLMPAASGDTRVMTTPVPAPVAYEAPPDDVAYDGEYDDHDDEVAAYEPERRNRGALIVAGVIAVAVLVGLGWWFLAGPGSQGTDPSETPTPEPTQTQEPAPEPTTEPPPEPTQEPAPEETQEPGEETTRGPERQEPPKLPVPLPTLLPDEPTAEGDQGDGGGDSDASPSSNDNEQQAQQRSTIAAAVSQVADQQARERLEQVLDRQKMNKPGLLRLRAEVETLQATGSLTKDEAQTIRGALK